MKKLSLLVALALLVTIGGVYATWTYAGEVALGAHMHMSVNMATATESTPKGEITCQVNSMDVKIDDTNNDYKAEAIFSGKMGFVFMPSKGVSDDVIANGITMQFQVEQNTPLKYNGQNIFIMKKDAPTVFAANEVIKISEENKTNINGTDLSNFVGGFYVEITADKMAEHVEISNITLDSHAEYLAMSDALIAGGALGISVSEAP